TWTATDDCGNSSTCDQIISVEDTTPPVITCPANATIECNEDPDPIIIGSASADDNCDPSPTITYSDVTNGNVITRTWLAEDACGNSSTCDQIIILEDTTPPVITCPADITIECDESTDPSHTGMATATDNCDQDVTITFTDTETAGVCPQERVITRKWMAMDDSNNSSTCDQIITVEDTTPPVITCPEDIEIFCYGPTDPDNTGYATAVDNCDDQPLNISYNDIADGNIITRTWTAMDACGNGSSCEQVITLIENVAPVAVCPDDMDILVCDLSPITISGFSCSDADGNLAACEVDNGTLTDGSVTFTPVVGENIITLTATDECGESASCAMTVAVTVNSPPEPSCPSDREMFVCSLEEICLPGFGCTDPDDNLVSCETSVGYLNGNVLCFTPVAGVNTIVLTATDECGVTAECTVNITVTVNTPPVAHCPGDMTLYLFDLEEVCIPGFYCDDIDDNLVSCEVNVGTLIGDEVCFTPVEGENTITLTATDECGGKSVCNCQSVINVVLITNCPKVTISKEMGVLQGHYRDVVVTLENATYEIGGFDLLLAYDASAISFMNAEPMEFINNCRWEYFTYRTGAEGNCGNACPSGLVRVFSLAETNDGYENPDCYMPPDAGLHDMFNMRFFVTNDRTFECQFIPIQFHWGDCGDNTFSSVTGDTLFVDRLIYDFTDNIIWDEDDDDLFPEEERPGFWGAPDYCLENHDPGKPTPIRCIDFKHGGINIICADDIDDRGDLNLNGISNEIADAVVFSNYFIHGLDAFVVNSEGQIAASDVNADGISLSVADLVYIIRVINGDVLPIDKIIPYESTVGIGRKGPVVIADAELGGAAFVFEGNVEVNLTEKASHMQIKSNFDGVNTRVLIYSFDRGAVFSGEILITDGRLLSVEASDYFGNLYRIGQLPQSFSLTSYPNPFNPTTIIEMTLPIASEWKIDIFNISGQKVSAYRGTNEAGLVKISWDATGQSSGIYFIKAQAGDYRAFKKAILLK
ncbi:MAG TPA: T9SS type A sorting domain-containing protein, partial [candidate division Zixibacteria bacterium]|nr:T9SS type A sorting domain-containing protein [candidate division Zixibacteria bacterium]